MSRSQRLIQLLTEQGPLSSAAVQKALGISRPTLSRLMREVNDQVLRLGQTRQIRYAVPRQLEGLPDSLPVYRVDEDGRAHDHARIRALAPSEWAWQAEDGLRIGTGLPREISALWPRGYMADAHFGQVGDEEEQLRLLSEQGIAMPGNLILGEAAMAGFLGHDPEPHSLDDLPKLAQQAEAGDPPGEPVPGDSPRFTAWMEGHQVLVRFAPLADSPTAQRQAGLLAAEAQALELLRRQGLPVAPARLLDLGGYRFLATARIDRVGRLGRRAVLPLRALSGKGVDPEDAAATATALKRSARLSAEEAEQILWLEEFFRLIGSRPLDGETLPFFPTEDALHLAPLQALPPSRLAPAEDGSLPERFPTPGLPATGELARWRSAAQAAAEYCQRLASDERLDFELRKLAGGHGKMLAERLERLG